MVTWRDRQTNTAIREKSEVQGTVRWGKRSRFEWSDHIDRLETDRLAHICNNERRGRDHEDDCLIDGHRVVVHRQRRSKKSLSNRELLKKEKNK